jgi:menaquinone-dependent protoporphyrinogen oxidase
MKRVLVAYATNSGSTGDVARVMGEELGKDGDLVDVRRIEEVDSLQGYQAVVVGAPMILGWHRGAVKFVKQHRQALGQVPVAFFATAMSLTQTSDRPAGGIPIYLDPGLCTPPHHPGRLSLKERYARVSNYLRPMLKAAPSVRPVEIGFFGGKLELFRLKFLQMLFVMVIIQAPPADLRNWPAIREWAAHLRPLLLEGEPLS